MGIREPEEYDRMMELFGKLNSGRISEAELEELKEYQKRFDEISRAKIEWMWNITDKEK